MKPRKEKPINYDVQCALTALENRAISIEEFVIFIAVIEAQNWDPKKPGWAKISKRLGLGIYRKKFLKKVLESFIERDYVKPLLNKEGNATHLQFNPNPKND